jgi:hypothetical protein
VCCFGRNGFPNLTEKNVSTEKSRIIREEGKILLQTLNDYIKIKKYIE